MLDESTIADLKAKHGNDLELFETELGDLVIKPATQPEWDRFTSRIGADDSDLNAALADLANACVVYPAPEKLREMRKQKPAILQGLGIKVQRLSGSKLLGEGKKL